MLLLCLFYLCVDVKPFYWYHTVYNFINSTHNFLLYFSEKRVMFLNHYIYDLIIL